MGLVSSRHSAKHLLNEQGMKVEQKEAWWPVYCQCTACTLPWEAGEGLSAHLTGAQEDWRAGPVSHSAQGDHSLRKTLRPSLQ